MGKKKVFFVTYGGGHANMIELVYKELIKQNALESEILALTIAPQYFDKQNIPCRTLSEYLPLFENREEITEIGQRLAAKAHNDSSGIRYEDSVAYLGLGYKDLCDAIGEEAAAEAFAKKGRKAFLPVNAMETILRGARPDVVVVTSSPRMEKAAAIAANRLEIPVVRIEDYCIVQDKVEYKAVVCVMNEQAKAHAIENNLASGDDIVITGQPVFEEELQLDGDLQRKYAVIRDKYREVILYVGQNHSLPEEEAAVSELRKLADRHKDFLFIMRPHPNDFMQYPEENLPNFIVTKQGKLNYLISAVSVVVTHDSTGGLTAALLDKPMITLIKTSVDRSSLRDMQIAVQIDDEEKLEETINACLDANSEISQFLEKGRILFKNKENAAANIAEVIRQQAER